MSTKNPIEVGGSYVENKDFVPNPTDMVAQYNTSGTGAHGKIEEVAPVFEVDKVKIAEEVLAATDPKNDNVPASRVLLPETTTDNETALKEVTEVAKARVRRGVVIGGPTPAERDAALDGDEGVAASVRQEHSNAAANSVGNNTAGQHDGDQSKTVSQKSDTGTKTASDNSATAKKAEPKKA